MSDFDAATFAREMNEANAAIDAQIDALELAETDASVIHYCDEDWDPLCRSARAGDQMWMFLDENVTCDRCRALAGQTEANR